MRLCSHMLVFCHETGMASLINGLGATELHLFTVIGHALCARSDVTSNIHYFHIDWEGDALLIGVAKGKRFARDQDEVIWYHIYMPILSSLKCVRSCRWRSTLLQINR